MSVLINGKAYAHANIIPMIGGVVIHSITQISYGESQEKENQYGIGKRPVSRGQGPIKPDEVSIEMSMNDVEIIRDNAPNKSLLQIAPFDIPVVYNNGQRVIRDVIKNCEFTTDGRESAVDNKDIKKTFTLISSHVEFSK